MDPAGTDETPPSSHFASPSLGRTVAVSIASVVVVAAGVIALAGRGENDRSSPETTTPASTSQPSHEDDRRFPVVAVDPDGVTIAAGSIFGLTPGRGVGPDDAVAAVTPQLGEPDHDTGWMSVNTQIRPCRDFTEYRELWWGDLSLGFWGLGSATYFHYWVVGDRRSVEFSIPAIDVPGQPTPTMLVTDQNVGVGDPITAIPNDANVTTMSRSEGARVSESSDVVRVAVRSTDPAQPAASGSRFGSYLAVDGEVVAFGAESLSC